MKEFQAWSHTESLEGSSAQHQFLEHILYVLEPLNAYANERKGSESLHQTLHFCTDLCALTVEDASSIAFWYLHINAVRHLEIIKLYFAIGRWMPVGSS